MKHITICADDFGLFPETSTAILTLLNNKRIHATSCMVNTKNWVEQSTDLKKIKHAKIGLHFTLTDVKPISLPTYSLPEILKQSFLKKINSMDMEKEITLQIERFEKTLGRLPDFIDGHQHVHQLPVIREALLSVYKVFFSKENQLHSRSNCKTKNTEIMRYRSHRRFQTKKTTTKTKNSLQ